MASAQSWKPHMQQAHAGFVGLQGIWSMSLRPQAPTTKKAPAGLQLQLQLYCFVLLCLTMGWQSRAEPTLHASGACHRAMGIPQQIRCPVLHSAPPHLHTSSNQAAAPLGSSFPARPDPKLQQAAKAVLDMPPRSDP